MSATLQGIFDINGIIANSLHEQIQEDFEILPGLKAEFVQTVGYGSPVTLDDDLKFQWINDAYLPDFATATGNFLTTDLWINVDDATVAQVGELVKIGEETARIDQIDDSGNRWLLERSTGANVAEAISTGQKLYLMSGAYLERDPFPATPTKRGEFKNNYPQTIMYSFEETVLRSGTTSYLTKGTDEIAFAEAKHIEEAARRLERVLFYGEKRQPAQGIPGQMDGIDAMIVDNVNAATGILDPHKLHDILDLVWEDAGDGSIDVWLSRQTKRIFDGVLRGMVNINGTPETSSVGTPFTRFEYNGGAMHMHINHRIKPGDAFFLKPSDISIRPINVKLGGGPGWNRAHRDVMVNGTLEEKDYFWGIFSLQLKDNRKMAKMKAINMSLANYPAAI